jgi:type 1 glutamine amidotransferase
MKTSVRIIAILFLFVLTLSGTSCRQKTEPVRVLLITGGHDFDKEPFYAFMKSLQGITVSEVKHPNALAMFRLENRALYDVILLYDMPNAISEQEKKDFTDCLKAGKGLVVWHHAYCSYQDWTEYQNIAGGRYHEKVWTDSDGVSHPASTYEHDVQFRVKVTDKKHPVTKGIQDFNIKDEVYGNGSVNPDVHLLLTTDNPSATPSVAWTNSYGKSKVVTILLGHDNQAWTNPSFVKLLTQAILWVK